MLCCAQRPLSGKLELVSQRRLLAALSQLRKLTQCDPKRSSDSGECGSFDNRHDHAAFVRAVFPTIRVVAGIARVPLPQAQLPPTKMSSSDRRAFLSPTPAL